MANEEKSNNGEIQYMPIRSNRKLTHGQMKRIVKEDKERNQQSRRPVSEKKRRKKTRGKISKKAILLALGISGAALIGGTHLLGSGENEKQPVQTQLETELENEKDKSNEWKRTLQVNEKEENIEIDENIEEQIKGLETQQQVKDYLKEMYKEAAGIDEIESIDFNNQNYICVTEGQILFTHGEKPAETAMKLENAGINYTTVADKDIYQVRVNGNVLDAMIIENGEAKTVIPASNSIVENIQAYEDGEYTSVLVDMSEVIEEGFDLYDAIGKAEIDKGSFAKLQVSEKQEDFIKAIEKYSMQEKNEEINQEEEGR